MQQTIERAAPEGRQNEDDQAVRALPDRLATAWASGDADAYAALFTPDADYILFDGSHSRGPAEIAASHRPVFEQFMTGSRLVVESVAVRFLADGIAVIHSKGGVARRHQRHLPSGSRSVQTMVAVCHGGDWLITAFQNTRYKPFADSIFYKIAQALTTRGERARAR
jgi:uncharacterized protein (TIGR02246 family)